MLFYSIRYSRVTDGPVRYCACAVPIVTDRATYVADLLHREGCFFFFDYYYSLSIASLVACVVAAPGNGTATAPNVVVKGSPIRYDCNQGYTLSGKLFAMPAAQWAVLCSISILAGLYFEISTGNAVSAVTSNCHIVRCLYVHG